MSPGSSCTSQSRESLPRPTPESVMFSQLWVLDHQVGGHLLDVGAVVIKHELVRRL